MTDHLIQRKRPDRDLLAPLKEEADESLDWEAGSQIYFPGDDELSGPLKDVYWAIGHAKETADSKAVAKLQSAIEKAGVDSPEPYFELAEMQVKLGRLKDAEKNYRRVIEMDPESIQAYNNLANVLADEGRAEDAAELLKKAIQLDNGYSADSFNNLGLVYVDLQQQSQAEEMFRKSAAANVFFADAHLNLGTLLFQQGKYAEAAEEFRRTLAIDPGVLRARNNLAFTLLALGRPDEAVPYLEEVVRGGNDSLRGPAQKALDLIRSSGR